MGRGREPGEDMGVRMAVFSFTVLLVPVLGLAWFRFVWQEAARPGTTAAELVRRTVLVAAAGLAGYVVLRALGAVAAATSRGLDALARRLDARGRPWSG